jgi:hypothetical protein
LKKRHRDNSLGTIFFELTNFKMTFRDRIVVREIDVRALLCGQGPFEALVREIDVPALERMNAFSMIFKH